MDYGRRQPEDGLRITVENTGFYRRGRSPSPRDRFRREDETRRNDRNFSPQRQDQTYPRDQSDGNKNQEYGRSPSPRRSPERYSSSWRRNSSERSPKPSPNMKDDSKRGRKFFTHSGSDSRRRRKSRSRSSSRGRGRYRNSRSPRRISPRRSDRSSSYGLRKKLKRGSSSSSGSSSDSDSRRSKSIDTKKKDKEDFFKTMYSKKDENESDSDGGTYLHPVLDRGPKEQQNQPVRPSVNTQSINQQSHIHSAPNAASLAALSQAYGNSPPKKSYTQQEIDDEDRFLYGDDSTQPVEEKPKFINAMPTLPQAPIQRPPQPEPNAAPTPSAVSQKVTPGGFDSNALKNVLKAIGFDFEMSKQSQTVNNPSIVPESKQIVLPDPVRQAPQVIETPQRIQTIHGGQVNRPPPPVPPPQPVHIQPPLQQYFQAYDPYNQNSNMPFTSQALPGTVNTNLGYPMHVQDPSNPGGSLLVYQPVSTGGPPQPIYQQHRPALIQSQPVSVHPSQESGRVVLPPHRSDMPEVKKTDKEVRKERLSYLQVQLDKLKKQQNEILRKKRREKDGHKDPLLKKNTMLQAGVEEQIREIRMAAEKAAGIDTTVDSSENEREEKEDKEEKYDYFDPGKHWCKLCNTISEDLGEFLSHLHSKSHRKAIDPYDRPWNDGEATKKNKSTVCVSKALKGSEFLIPITGYFCTLCQTFSGDQICAEDHCKSYLHNTTFKKHCKKNPSYEKKCKKKKKAALNSMENGKKEIKQEPEEKEVKYEVKYVEKPPKLIKEDTKKKHKHIEKESIWVEKPIKYQADEAKYPEKEIRVGKKKDKKRRSSEKETPREEYNLYSDRREVQRRSNEKQTYREEPKPEKKIQRNYSEEFQPLPPRPNDHGRRRQNRWSPGYDEYERQQDDRFDKKREQRHSHSRDREEEWMERSLRDEPKKPDHREDRNISGGGKIPTPGFGKFSWNSNSKTESNVIFDQVPVDTPIPMHDSHGNKNGDFAGKGKIAIKITGKTSLHPPRMSATSSRNNSTNSHFDKAAQEKRTSMASELQRKVEALKRENALRAQLSSITLPAGRSAKQFQSKPNTAAVILGARSIGKHNTLRTKPQLPKTIPVMTKLTNPPLPREDKIFHIEADVSPHRSQFPPLPEPPPPGEEDITMGDGDDGANSDASGISMEIASDEE